MNIFYSIVFGRVFILEALIVPNGTMVKDLGIKAWRVNSLDFWMEPLYELDLCLVLGVYK